MSFRGYRGGGRTVTTGTTTATSTSNQQPPLVQPHKAQKAQKAQHVDNQEALDRLQGMLERVMSSQSTSSNYVLTLKRAMNSVRNCRHPITTLDQALELKFVGERLSRVVVPTTTTTTTTTTKAAAAVATTKKRPARTFNQSAAGEDLPVTKKRVRSEPSEPSSSSSSSTTATISAKTSAKETAYETAKKQAEELILPSGPWKVILLVDIRERKSKNVVSQCQQRGIPCEERSLPIGDMAWIAQCTDPATKKVVEVLLGTILERKEVHDLACSLFGTRFSEQRLRLYHCGLPQILYLVEGEVNAVANCPAETLHMAMVETRIQLGFSIVQTKHLEDTVRVLRGLHRRIVQRTFPDAYRDNQDLPTFTGRYSGPQSSRRRPQRRAASLLELVFDTPPVPPFGRQRFMTYAELKAKIERDREAGTQTVGAIYMAMLKQVTSLSQKKCQAIAAEYPTWSHLLTAYDQVCETPSSSPLLAERSANDFHQPKLPSTALLVKDVLVGRQKVGPKSAAELDIACCVQGDGTLRRLREGASSIPPVTQKKPPPAAAAATTASIDPTRSTTSSNSNSATATLKSNTKSTMAASTTAAATGSAAGPSSRCLDLTLDTPPLPKQPPARHSAEFATSYEPSWHNNDCSSEDDDDILKTPLKPTAGRASSYSLSSNSDDYDFEAKMAQSGRTLSDPINMPSTHSRTLPSTNSSFTASQCQAITTARSTIQSTDHRRIVEVAARSQTPDSSGEDSTVYFSSPSSTASGLDESQNGVTNSSSNEKKKKKSAEATKASSTANNSINQDATAEASIVVIDSSDDENYCVAKAPPSSITSSLPLFSQDESSSTSNDGEQEDLRSRLAKRMGKETIVID